MVYDSTIAQVAASNPQAAYALANVPVAAPQAQQPALQMAQAPQADSVNFSSAAAVAYQPQQEEKSLFSLKNIVLGAGAILLGRAALKTHGALNAFKELKVTNAGKAIAEGAKDLKVSDTHELSKMDTFLHYLNPMNLFRKQAAPEGLKAVGDEATGLLEKEDASLVFKHGDVHFDLKAKDGIEVAPPAPKPEVYGPDRALFEQHQVASTPTPAPAQVASAPTSAPAPAQVAALPAPKVPKQDYYAKVDNMNREELLIELRKNAEAISQQKKLGATSGIIQGFNEDNTYVRNRIKALKVES